MEKNQLVDRIKAACLRDSHLRGVWFDLTIAALDLRLALTEKALSELRSLPVAAEAKGKIAALEEVYKNAFLKLHEVLRPRSPDGLPLFTVDDICNTYV